MKIIIKILSIVIFGICQCFAQGVMKIQTDKTNYSYGDSINVRVTISNNADTSFSIWGSSSCIVRIGFDNIPFQIACTADYTEFPFAPHSSRTWTWELRPSELGIPEKDGVHTIYAYGGGFRDSITITAPKYYGGRLGVGFDTGTAGQKVQLLRDSLKAEVIFSDTLKSLNVIQEEWQISGYSVDSLDTAYSKDPRLNYVEVERPLFFQNEVYTGVKSNITKLKDYNLSQNYPNPFNPSTTISYSIPKESFVTLKVYDILGKELQTLVAGEKLPGKYKIIFDATKYSSGIYFYIMHAGDFIETKKLILQNSIKCLTMRLYPTATSRSGFSNIFGIVAPFRQTCSKLSDLAITFQIIGSSILIGVLVLGGG